MLLQFHSDGIPVSFRVVRVADQNLVWKRSSLVLGEAWIRIIFGEFLDYGIFINKSRNAFNT